MHTLVILGLLYTGPSLNPFASCLRTAASRLGDTPPNPTEKRRFREHTARHRLASLVAIEWHQLERALIPVYPDQPRHKALGQHGRMLSRR